MPSIIELARRLHEEKLFVKSEQDSIFRLNDQVRKDAEDLSHMFWITRYHHLNLNELIGKNIGDNPSVCSHRANQLDRVQFVNAYDELGFEESKYIQFLEAFINNPTLIAACLAYGDKLGLDYTSEVAHTIVLGCYGNSIITDNHKHLLELLETLMLLQIAQNEQPRRMMQKGKCAFSIVYNLFAESLMASKLFLMSALQEPIMKVLTNDDLYLETNETKILESLSDFEIERRFGRRTDISFQKNLSRHIKQSEEYLVEICSIFVQSLVKAMPLFPQSLGWVIARAFHIVKDSGNCDLSETKALSADFLLQSFICPAIVDPERYGITGNIPVSSLARSNLMQVAQVLQVAAHTEVLDKSSLDQMDQVKITIKDLIDVVISTCNAQGAPQNKNVHGHISSAIFLTSLQISQLILFLRQIQISNVHGVDQTSLAEILSLLPKNPPEVITRATNSFLSSNYPSSTSTDETTAAGSGSGGKSVATSSGSLLNFNSSNQSPSSKRLFHKNSKSKSKLNMSREDIPPSDPWIDETNSPDGSLGPLETSTIDQLAEKVLVINLTSSENHFNAGNLTESEVLEMHRNNCVRDETATNATNSDSLDEENGIEKQSQFSVYIGGSNLSEIGELPIGDGNSQSERSESSSLDLDQSENGVGGDDNSSFIAGGSSQGGNQDEDELEEAGDLESIKRSSNDEALKVLRRKIPTSRESIEDKMRKFELRKNVGGSDTNVVLNTVGRDQENSVTNALTDTKSETWSVDVYASDSEQTNEQSESQNERLREIAVDPVAHIRRSPASMGSLLNAIGRTDEDSRSDIWSVEVLASDSEPPDNQSDYRLQDLDSEPPESVNTEEDNRSRASTPGLSAASGYSVVSGVSVVSDNQKNYSAATGNALNSDKSAPSSSSPDADELREPSTSRSFTASVTRAFNDVTTSKQREKSVAWKLPGPESAPMTSSNKLTKSPMTSSAPDQVNEFDGGTIKRSPYKKKEENWFEENSSSLVFVPVDGEPKTDQILKEFDPLADEDKTPSKSPALLPSSGCALSSGSDSKLQQEIKIRSEENQHPRKVIERKKSWWKPSKFTYKKKSISSSSSKTPPSRFSSVDQSPGEDLLSSPIPKPPGEDIMLKYIKKMSGKTSSQSEDLQTDQIPAQKSSQKISSVAPGCSSISLTADEDGYWQKNEMESTKEEKRENAKKKLRMVLSAAEPRPEVPSPALLLLGSYDRQSESAIYNLTSQDVKDQVKIKDQILSFIQNQLSQALVLQDSSRAAQLREVKRCVATLDNTTCRSIYQDLWREYNQRSSYIAYLVRVRQHLLTASSYFSHLTRCIEKDKIVCRQYFTRQCVRIFLKKREASIDAFTRQFFRFVASDDKVKLIGEFLRKVYGQLVADPIWKATSQEQFNEAKCCIEQIIFTSIYNTAMFPNGDADQLRDQVYHDHINRLSKLISPTHQALQINPKYLLECPWYSAQSEARSIVTYRTPRGKLAAALRCCKTIMYLLKMADETNVPGADDFTPVLVYVLIMV